jgi:hypothetical protein
MKFLYRIKNFIPKQIPKPLGRWGLDYCKIKLNNKVDLSNEDHCGPCGKYALEKLYINKIKLTRKT